MPPRVASLLLVLTVAAACGPSAITEPSAVHVTAAQMRFPGATQATLAEGRQLLIEHCGGCHGAPLPTAKRPEDWPKLLTEMAPRARLDAASRAKVEAYLVGVSSAR